MKNNYFFISLYVLFFCLNFNYASFANVLPPLNDDCDNAIALNCGDTIVGETLTATDSGGNPAADVFYTFTGNGNSQLVILSLCDGNTDYDSFIRIYSDCTLNTQLFSNDDFCDLQSTVSFVSDGTSTYYIMIEGYDAYAGNFSLSVACTEPPPINDLCENAISLNCDETVFGETLTATDSGYNISSDVFYSYTGSGNTELVTISLCDDATNYDSWLRVFDACDLNNQLASNDDFCGLQSEITFVSDGVSTYIIMVEGYQANAGEFSLFTTCQDFNPPPNNECTNSIAIACGDIITGDTSISSSNGGNNSPDLFYNYTGSGAEEWVTLSTCSENTEYNTRLLVYDNCNFDELLSENDDFCDNFAQLTFYSDGISTYQIIVEGSGNAAGIFELSLSCEAILSVNDTTNDGFNFYPNPVKNIINLSSINRLNSIEILDILGKNVLNQKINDYEKQIDVSSLNNGTYFLKINIETGIGIYKIIKQ